MIIEPLAATETKAHCKICGGQSALYGVTDFNKSCAEGNGQYLPLAGVPVYYHQCGQCGLVFTNAFDRWDKQHYKQYIYNDDYIKIDPEYKEIRPRTMCDMVCNFLEGRTDLKLLDYGGGDGELARRLNERNVNCVSWDPMEENSVTPAKGQFDFVTAFEVFEHTPTPERTVRQMLSYLKTKTGLLLFTTLTIDTLPPRAINFWYIAPRNGHVTIYTKKSLETLFSKQGFKLHHFNEGTHLAYKTFPKLPDASAA